MNFHAFTTNQWNQGISSRSAWQDREDLHLPDLPRIPAGEAFSRRQAATITFTGTELLGSRKPIFRYPSRYYPAQPLSCITSTGQLRVGRMSTPPRSATGTSTPTTVTLTGLTPNTRYYYRMQYSSDGGSTWVIRPEHSFMTQRSPGTSFVFDITTDSHINVANLGIPANWTAVMNDVARDNADFQFDLGDTFNESRYQPGRC